MRSHFSQFPELDPEEPWPAFYSPYYDCYRYRGPPKIQDSLSPCGFGGNFRKRVMPFLKWSLASLAGLVIIYFMLEILHVDVQMLDLLQIEVGRMVGWRWGSKCGV